MAMMTNDGLREHLFKKKNEIEHELLRRWEAREESAKLEIFSDY
jgi:hypothetical protein